MKVRVLVSVLLLMLLVSVSGVMAQDQTIVEAASANEDLSTFVSLVETAGLAETLSGEGSYTVFAPTNAAFEALPAVVIDYLTSEVGADMLSQILQYHVVDGAVMSGDLASGMVASMDMGNELTVVVDDMGVMVDQATVTTADVAASNGVVHVIDAVLVPPITLTYEDPAFVEGTVVAAGSSTVEPVTNLLMDQYREEAGGESAAISLTNTRSGSGSGFESFCEKAEIDFSNASRAIKDTEVAACAELDPPRYPIEFRVGTDALSVVVNPNNDWADDVTLEELAALLGTATTWADVREGWPEEEILRFTPGDESGTYGFFNEEVFDDDASIPAAASNLTTNSDDNVLVRGVAENVNAIGYFGYAFYVNNSDQLKVLSVEGIEPSAATVEAGYPLARPLFIYGDAGVVERNPAVGEFIKYYLEHANEAVLTSKYFPADPFGLNVAKLKILAATEMAGAGM